MVRWVAFAGVVSVLVTLLLALTRSSAAVVRETEPGETSDESSTTARVREALGGPNEGVSPLPWRSDDEPDDPLSGPGGTELTTLDESDYPDPPPEHARPTDQNEETAETHDDPPDPSEAFPISGEAEYADPDRPSADELDDSEPTEPTHDGPTADDPLPGPSGEPTDRTGRGDRWGDAAGDRDRWRETDATPEDRWDNRPTDTLDEVGSGDDPDGAAADDTAVGDSASAAGDSSPAVGGRNDTESPTEPRPGIATAATDPDGLTPGGFDDPDPFAGETDGFDPRLPSERDEVRVGDRELSTTVLLANVVGSQLLFAGLLVAVTIWAAVPATALGLGSVTLSQVAVGGLVGVGLWVASESGGRLSRRIGVDPAEALRGALAPTTRREWWLLLGLVLPVVAVFEELLFRAALVGAFAAGFEVPVAVLIVGSSAVFGLAHSAQGRVGMAVTGLLGVVLATAFVLTESLVVVVVAHYVVNAAEFVVHEGPVSQFPTE